MRKSLQLTVIASFIALFFTSWSSAEQPANLSDLKAEIEGYLSTGGYWADLFGAVQPAYPWLETRMANAAEGERLAVVFDIDDTALSSLPAQQANNFGFFPQGTCDALPKGPCGWTGWVAREDAAAIEPVLAIYDRARALGYAVVFISGRMEDWRQETANNLQAAGFQGWDQLILKPADLHVSSAADYKAPARERLEAEGFTIVLNIGDQVSDLEGGHAERTVLLPNPFYRIP